MLRKFSYNFEIALEAIGQNKLRALLTSLGIIFGVASVIAMLAIGRGAQQEILAQMDVLGVDNIIIRPVVEQVEGSVGEEEADVDAESENEEGEEGATGRRFSPGLSLHDASSLMELPFVKAVSPEIVEEAVAIRNGRKRSTKLVGVSNAYFEDQNLSLMEGKVFSQQQLQYGYAVCIIGYDIKARFFPTEEPLGKTIKVGDLWLKVVGIMKPRKLSQETRSSLSNLGIRNFDLDIYVPVKTMLLRYENRTRITPSRIRRAERDDRRGRLNYDDVNYHQLDKLVVKVADTRYMMPLADVCNRMLTRRHNEVVDFEVVVPEVLLKQKQETTEIFNFVLGAIASISLIVGGIGIMNIMLASVLERIKEIGLRLSLGATQRDVVLQFLCEAIAISVSGGIIGIILGIVISKFVASFANIETIVSLWSVVISFFVAVGVGLVFGLYPARQAARQDPVVSLRSN
ncbi:MAG: FtsX-like permease family protein [Bacteroidetes bacterium]|nr:MAG: FtsX-like permease family protein [Bacteroidota bacterium]